MSPPVRPNNSWSLSGSLSEQSAAQLIERCQRLRFTGRLRLINADPAQDPTRAEAQWVGGEIVDIVDTLDQQGAADESALLAFRAGTFQLTQGLPDLDGTLLEQTELSGDLRPGLVQRLYELCNRARLSALLTLSNSAAAMAVEDAEVIVDLDGAEVHFNQGRVEAATIAGEPQAALQALAQLSGWTAGSFRIQLRPLFSSVEEAPPAAEPAPVIIIESRREASGAVSTKSGREFDVTGVGLTQAEAAPPAAATPPAATPPAPPRPQLKEAKERKEPPPALPLPSAAPAAGPWIRAVLAGVVLGTVAFLVMLSISHAATP